MRRRMRLPSFVVAASAAALLVTCVTDEVRRRPAEPRPDRPTPSMMESPPFAASASENQEAARPSQAGSQPLLEGQIVQSSPSSITVLDDGGNRFELKVTPQTVVRAPLEQGERVRASWAMDADEGLSATAIVPAEGGAPAPQVNPQVNP